MNRFASLAAAAFIALSAPVAHAATDLITNGSFEATVLADHSWKQPSNLPGWTGGARGIELRNGDVGHAYDGNNFVELDTTGNSSMSQSVATTAGTHYTLSFAYSPRPKTGAFPASSNDIAVTWGGTQLALLSGLNASTEHQWTLYSFDVVGAAAASTMLTFTATGRSDSYGGSLDKVSLFTVAAPVPEPETYALMLAGLAALGAVARRRARHG